METKRVETKRVEKKRVEKNVWKNVRNKVKKR